MPGHRRLATLFRPRYEAFLQDGYVAAPDTLLAKLGVSLSDPALLDSDFELLRGLVDELEALQAQNTRVLRARARDDTAR